MSENSHVEVGSSPLHGSRPSAPRAPLDPPFLHERTEHYYDDIITQDCQGIHPLKGRAATADGVRLHTNDYLCLAGDPRIIEAEIRVLQEAGHGDSLSRVWSHQRRDRLRRFEERMAALTGAEDGVLCSSGYTANTGLIQAIADPERPVYIDLKAHMSLREGVLSARAVARSFRHNDPEHLAHLVARHGPGIIIIDSLYSTDGAVAPLKEFVEVSERFGCALVVDETHSFGTHGRRGEGLVASQGLAERVHFRTIGLSKAVASRGGIVLCSSRNAEFFRYTAHPAIFSTSVLAHEVAGYEAALDIFEAEPWRRAALHANHAVLRAGLDRLGYNVDNCHSQILALEPGETRLLIILRDALESRGVFGAVFYPPAVTKRRSLVRLSVHCGLEAADIEHVLRVCRDIREEVRVDEWRTTQRRGAERDGGADAQAPVRAALGGSLSLGALGS